MLLSEIFEYLTYGELAQLDISGVKRGGIAEEDYPKIITAVNLGMIELYTRFSLKERELILQLYDQITMYTLHSDFATNGGSAEPIKYILDTAGQPFSNDILLITQVYNEEGTELPLNDLNEEYSVHTPEVNMLQVPFPEDNNTLSLIYRAYPTKLAITGIDPLTTILALPPQFLGAMTAFVAHRIFASLNLGEPGEANTYFAKFEAACAKLKELGTLNVDTNVNTKFGDNQWP